MVDRYSSCHVQGHSRPSQCPPYWANHSTSHDHCLKPAIGKVSASGHGHTYLQKTKQGYKGSTIFSPDMYVTCLSGSSNVTFEAAVSANEEEADFILVSITHGASCTCRTSGGCEGSRVAVGGRLRRLLNGNSHLWHHCRRYTHIHINYCVDYHYHRCFIILYQYQQKVVSPVDPR